MLVSFSETEAEVIFFQFTATFYRNLENNIARLFFFALKEVVRKRLEQLQSSHFQIIKTAGFCQGLCCCFENCFWLFSHVREFMQIIKIHKHTFNKRAILEKEQTSGFEERCLRCALRCFTASFFKEFA